MKFEVFAGLTQTHALFILALLVLVVMIVSWIAGFRKDKSAADRILMQRGVKKGQSFTAQVDELLKKESH